MESTLRMILKRMGKLSVLCVSLGIVSMIVLIADWAILPSLSQFGIEHLTPVGWMEVKAVIITLLISLGIKLGDMHMKKMEKIFERG